MKVVSICFLEGLDMDCERKRDNTKVFGLKNCKDKESLIEMGNTIRLSRFGAGGSFLDFRKKRHLGQI